MEFYGFSAENSKKVYVYIQKNSDEPSIHYKRDGQLIEVLDDHLRQQYR